MCTKIEEKLIETVRAVTIEGRRDVALFESGEDMSALCKLAVTHQVEHLLAYVLIGAGHKRFEKPFYASAGLTAKQSGMAESVRGLFKDKKIPFILLKGLVLRRLYPEDWMRNSCDLDILVHPCDMDRAGEVLLSLGFEREDGLSAHDVTYKLGTVHIELHFDLIEEHVFPEVSQVLSHVWENSCESGYEYVMSDEFFYFYHVAHMAKHFQNGGCGIRSILDLWFLNHKCEFSKKKRDELLAKGGLLKFDEGMRALAEAWFSGASYEGLDVLEKFVISGGAYGRTDNSVAVKKRQRGGRLGYFFSRIFAPMSLLKKYYPVLEKHPYLMPIFQVKRWIDALVRDRKKYVHEFRENIKNDKNSDAVGKMLDELGLIK